MSARSGRRCAFALLCSLPAFTFAVFAQEGTAAAPADQAAPQEASTDLFSQPANAASLRHGLLSVALAEVEASRTLEGKFTQRRTMRGLSRPLESSGEFLLVRDLGLQWHTLQPVDDEFVLTRKGVSSRDRRPGERRRQPPLGAATELLFALFSLDLQILERRFDLYGTGSAQDWQIGMRPRDRATARAVREATVMGGDRVRSIALVNGNGDELRIEFSDVSVRAGELSDEQRAIFR